MGLRFNMLLADAGIDPADVRLLRHQTNRDRGQTPYSLWRDDREAFRRYQSSQAGAQRERFRGRYWASFVAPTPGASMFVGLYQVALLGPVPDFPTDDQYDCRLSDALTEYVGRLFVHWGDTPNSKRAWVQRADNQDKPIVELMQEYQEEAFPGCTKFTRQLSEIESLPRPWKAVLSEAKGVYVLTCPRTREQYVGSASGDDGFLGRWLTYVATGHGGNVALKHRDPSDFVISILEVAGSAASVPDIVAMEEAWKRRLLSREIGLNR